MISRSKSKPALALVFAIACIAAGCAPYGMKPHDDPAIAPAILTIDNLSALRLKGGDLTIDAIDGEAAGDRESAVLYPGKRSILVSAALTAPLPYRGRRIPLRSCDAKLDLVAKPGERYRVIADDLWRTDVSVKIVEERSAAVAAMTPCNRHDPGHIGF